MECRVEEKLKIIRKANKYPYEYGTILYDYIIENKPKQIIELGTGHGFTTLCMGIALRENNFGEVASYDYYEEPGWETNIGLVQNEVDRLELNEWVQLRKMDAYKWLEKQTTQKIDMLYLDIHNGGEVIEFFVKNKYIKGQMENGMPLFFEGGGNSARELVCAQRGQKKFTEMDCSHELLYDARTGLSVIWGNK